MGRKYGSVEETVMFKSSPYSKYESFYQRTESRAFVLFFVRIATEFLIAKHWLSLRPVTQKLRRTVLKKINSE